MHLSWVHVSVKVRAKGVLTDAGAEVSILSVGPVVVGIAVVAAHRLQLDLLDLHGLCDGRVGSCCRRRCQAWGVKGRGDRALRDRYVSAGAEPLHLQNLFRTLPRQKKKKNMSTTTKNKGKKREKDLK